MYNHECKTLEGSERYPNPIGKFRELSTRSPFTLEQFLLFLKYFPNIEEIDLTEIPIDIIDYMSFLMNVNLHHIKIITTDTNNVNFHDFEIYFSTCFRYRDTLTNLYFYCSTNTNFNHYFNKMNQFKNLKQLLFQNDFYDNLIIFQVLDLCPQLIDLTYNSYNSWERPDIVLEPSDQKLVAGLNKKLQRLKIILPYLPVSYTKYLTDYIEDGLRTVDICVTTTWFYEWIKHVGMEDALNLMKKLGQLNDVCISFLNDYLLHSTHLSNGLKIAKWLQLVKAFKGHKKTTCTVRFREYCESRQLHYHFKSSPSQLYFEFNSHTTNFFREPEENFIYGYDERPLESMKSISTIEPESIDRLEISLPRKKKSSEIWNILIDAFTLFRDLLYIKITNCFQVQVFTDREKNELNGIQNSLKMIYSFSSIPIDAFFDLFPTYLLNIEVLVFGILDCQMFLDLTRFKNLKQCHFVIQRSSCEKDPPPFFFNFEYLDGKAKSYAYEQGELMETKDYGYYFGSFTFKCKKDTNFVIYFGLNT